MEKLSGGEWTVCLCLRLQWENKGIFILFNVHENELVDAILTHWIVIFVWNIVMLLNQNNVCFLMSVRLMESCFFLFVFLHWTTNDRTWVARCRICRGKWISWQTHNQIKGTLNGDSAVLLNLNFICILKVACVTGVLTPRMSLLLNSLWILFCFEKGEQSAHTVLHYCCY